MSTTVNIIVKKGDKKTQPSQVLGRAKKYIRESGLSKNEQINKTHAALYKKQY
jgi:hypothetical protein